MTSSSGCSRQLQLGFAVVFLAYCSKDVLGWKHGASSPRMWAAVARGGSTSSYDETALMESFQQEVNKVKREIQAETNDFVAQLRQEIMQAKQQRAIQQQKAREEEKKREMDEVEATKELDKKPAAAAQDMDAFSLEEDFSEGLDDDLAPGGEERQKVSVFEEDTDDFVVGDSDEEPDVVLHRMKKGTAIKLEDLVSKEQVTEKEKSEEIGGDLGSSLESGMKVSSSLKLTRKKSKKKAKKAGDEIVRPKKKKMAKEEKTKKKLSKEKEAIRTALSSKTTGNRLLVLKSSKMEALVKGVVLVILLAFALLALKIIENSVTKSAPAAGATAAGAAAK